MGLISTLKEIFFGGASPENLKSEEKTVMKFFPAQKLVINQQEPV
ncbi:hypothetical protein [Salmonella enterica]|nr:hypothetical protein [Salmonella enterica]